MNEKKYKLLKNFTPRDLYEAHAPIRFFIKYLRDSVKYLRDSVSENDTFTYAEYWVNNIYTFQKYKHWVPWLIENKFIEEYEDDIVLTPGMILKHSDTGCELIMTNNGLYYSKGYVGGLIGKPVMYLIECKKLQELNKNTGCKWEVIY